MLPTGHHAPTDVVRANHLLPARPVVSTPKQKPKPSPAPALPTPKPPAPAPQTFVMTAYTAACDTGCTGVTATGFDVRHTIYANGLRIVAVDPAVIPLGSRLRVYDDGRTIEAVAADTGGAINGRHIDLLVGSRAEALAVGRREVKIEIIKGER